MKINNDLLVLCYYCGTYNIDTNNIIIGMLLLQCTNDNDNTSIFKGYWLIFNAYSETKQIVKVASVKGDLKRAIVDVMNKNKVKRTKRRSIKESNIGSDVSIFASYPSQRSTSS